MEIDYDLFCELVKQLDDRCPDVVVRIDDGDLYLIMPIYGNEPDDYTECVADAFFNYISNGSGMARQFGADVFDGEHVLGDIYEVDYGLAIYDVECRFDDFKKLWDWLNITARNCEDCLSSFEEEEYEWQYYDSRDADFDRAVDSL